MATKEKSTKKATKKPTASKAKAPVAKKPSDERVKEVSKLQPGDVFKQGDRTRGTIVYEVMGAPQEEKPNQLLMKAKIIRATKDEKAKGKKENLHFQKRLQKWKTVEIVKTS